jgi:Arc/MetJ-type ribon-helix-helix transcriptional regulator
VTTDLSQSADWGDLLQAMLRLMHALDQSEPADLNQLLAGAETDPDTRRAAEALFALKVAGREKFRAPGLLKPPRSDAQTSEPDAPDVTVGGLHLEVKPSGTARKVSVSMPEDLTTAVQRRAGRGKFSQYVTEAVTRQLELDLLAELSELLGSEHGPVPEGYLAEARAAWPDGG